MRSCVSGTVGPAGSKSLPVFGAASSSAPGALAVSRWSAPVVGNRLRTSYGEASVRVVHSPPASQRPQITSLLIAGEPFIVNATDGLTSIEHGAWSLMGSGRTLAQAKTSLLKEVREL